LKNVNEILNSVFNTPADKPGLSKDSGTVSPKGSQSNGNSFEDILSQVASQEAASASGDQTAASNTATTPDNNSSQPSETVSPPPASGMGTVTSITETEVVLTEHVHVDSLDQLQQAEKSLVALAQGLAQVLNSLSGLPASDAAQAQNALVALGGGAITSDEAKSLVDSLQALTQKYSQGQNPLQLSADQQNILLSQVIQQMFQNQQAVFGTFINANAGNSSAVSAVDPGSFSMTSDMYLQMSFSETQLFQTVQSNTQSSQVFINLENFQMSASFIQLGAGDSGKATFQPISMPRMDALMRALDQALLTPVSQLTVSNEALPSGQGAPVPASDQEALSQNLRDLVQTLVQAGASQAVLINVSNNQKNLNASEAGQALVQTNNMDNQLQSLDAPSLVAPVTETGSNSGPSNSEAGFLFMESVSVQALVTQAEGQTSAENTNAILPAASPAVSRGLNSQVINALNDVVARLNVLSALETKTSAQTVMGPLKPTMTMDQLMALLNNQAPVSDVATPTTQTLVNQTQVGNQLISTSQVVQNATTLTQSNSTSDQTPSIVIKQNVVESISVLQAQTSQATTQPLTLNSAVETPVSIQPPAATSEPNSGVSPESDLRSVTSLPIDQTITITLSDNQILNTNIPYSVIPEAGTNTKAAVQPAVNFNAPQPGSPVSNTMQEVITPDSTDPQVRVSNAGPVSTTQTDPVPVATTPTTTVPASTAGNVPASIIVGEAVKAVLQAPIVLTQNIFSNNVQPVLPTQPLDVQPITPQGVTPVASDITPNLNLGISLDLNQNAKNNPNDVQTPSIPLIPIQDSGKKASSDAIVGQIAGMLANPASLIVGKGSGDETGNIQQAKNDAQSQRIDSVQVLNQVTEQILAHANESRAVSRLSFQLIPESLGRVTVQIALVDQSISARLIVSNPEVKDTLQHHLVELKTSLSQAGLQIDQLQVQVGGGSSNLLAQYYQFQQEGYGNRLPAANSQAVLEDLKNLENEGVLGPSSTRNGLVDVLV